MREDEHKKKFKKITHVIFDIDGTLLNTEKLYRQALFYVAELYDKKCSNEVVLKIAGTPQTITAKIAREELGLPIDNEVFLRKYNGYIIDRLGDCDLMPGAERLIRHLYHHGVPMAVATSCSTTAFKIKTKKHKEIFDLMDHVVCGDSDPEVKRGKPNPDIFLVCASRFPLKPAPQDCLVFEDSLNGVKGAKAAGMQVVMIPEPHVPREFGEYATLRVDSFHHFEPELFGLPSEIDRKDSLRNI